MELSLKDIASTQSFTPRYDPKAIMIIITFEDEKEKDKLLNLPYLDRLLTSIDVEVFKITPSNTLSRSEKIIFLWNLNPVNFYLYNIEEGNSIDETMDMKKKEMIEDITERIKHLGMIVTEHHFIQHDANAVPRALKITFESKEQANKFLKEDTQTRCRVLLSRSKKFNQHIPIKQCRICRKTNHREGDSTCRCDLRCPTCLSTEHSQPKDNCRPYCWIHKESHSSGSDRCPNNIQYKREQKKNFK